MNVRYIVELTDEERTELQRPPVGGGKAPVRRVKRAQVLLAAERGQGDAAIANALPVGTSTVYRTKRRFVEEGLEAALSELPHPGVERKLSGQEERRCWWRRPARRRHRGGRAGRWSCSPGR